MTFLRVLLSGFDDPLKFAEALKGKPAPYWGLYAQLLRSLLDSLLIYLPVALMGRQPATPSFLTFIPTESYYATLVWLTPLVFLTQWFLGAAVIHTLLRLLKLSSDMDQILNLTGLAGLVIAVVLVIWDWFWFALGLANQYFLGFGHLLIDVWWFVLVVTSLKKLIGVPVRFGLVVSLIAFAVAMPFAVLLMRSPF